MYNTAFFRTKLGHASLASVTAMAAMIALTSQINLASQDASFAQPNAELVELA